jgi:hypothetical protein
MAEKISKQEAVRRALAHFGKDAKPALMKPWIKDEFGIEMGADHISTAKGSILRAAAKGKRKPGRPRKTDVQGAAAQAAPKSAGRSSKESGIPVNDILYIKALVGRFGTAPIHTLIDAFAR